MWVEILFGVVLYKLLTGYFFDDDASVADSSDFDATFAVSKRLEKLYGGKAYVGLRIPDADTGSRQTIDIVLLTKTELMVVAVRNLSGFVEANDDGNWLCTRRGHRHHKIIVPDPMAEVSRQSEILSLYLEQRGLTLPKGYLTSKVILPKQNCSLSTSLDFMPGVISFDKWSNLKADSKSGFSNWVKDVFGGNVDRPFQKIHSILNTSPAWDRLELKGNANILGEFVEFKGKPDSVQSLRCIKRSKVSHFIVQKSSIFGGLGRSKLQILYVPRDYRSEGAATSDWREVTIVSDVEVLFMPMDSTKVKKIKLSHVNTMSFSA